MRMGLIDAGRCDTLLYRHNLGQYSAEIEGRYRIEPDEQDARRESRVPEMDAGEKPTRKLIDSRRNLQLDETVFGNTGWELYALKKAKGENPGLPPPPR